MSVVKKSFAKPFVVTAIFSASILIGFSVASSQVFAASFPGCSSEPAKPRRLPALTEKLFKRLAPVDALISPEPDQKTGVTAKADFKAGWRELQKIVDRCDDCNPYEKAQLFNRAAYVNYSLDNTKDAINYYAKVVALTPNIPLPLEQQTMFTMAQLKASLEDYKGSLDTFKKWEKTCPTVIPKDYNYMLAQIFYQTNDKDTAIKYAKLAVSEVEAAGDKPKEAWYRLLMALYVDKEDYKSGAAIGEKIVVGYPSTKNISQLAGLYGMLGRDNEQLGLLDALNVVGGLDKDSQVRNLASLYQQSEAPYLAAKVLDTYLKKGTIPRNSKNLEYLGAALRQAQEAKKSIPIMEEAAKLSSDGKIYAQLSAVYLDAEEFKNSIEAANKAINKGGLKNAGEPYFYKGNAQMQLKEYGEAITSLRKAVKDDRYGKYATDLLRYVEAEKTRLDGLEKSKQEAEKATKIEVLPDSV